MVIEHHEADDEENQTNGHQELFAVMTGHAVFMVDGEEIDAPAGTIVFVRDPALLRAARATADGRSSWSVDLSERCTPFRTGSPGSRNRVRPGDSPDSAARKSSR